MSKCFQQIIVEAIWFTFMFVIKIQMNEFSFTVSSLGFF